MGAREAAPGRTLPPTLQAYQSCLSALLPPPPLPAPTRPPEASSVTFLSSHSSYLWSQVRACLPEDWEERGCPTLSHSFSGCARPRPGRQVHLLEGMLGAAGVLPRWSAPSGVSLRGGKGPQGGWGGREEGEHDFGQRGFDLPNVIRQEGADARSRVTPGSHRRCPAQVFTRGNSWQAGRWAGAHRRHRVAISSGEKRWARPAWRRLQPPARSSFQGREGGRLPRRERAPSWCERG